MPSHGAAPYDGIRSSTKYPLPKKNDKQMLQIFFDTFKKLGISLHNLHQQRNLKSIIMIRRAEVACKEPYNQ